MFFFFKHKKAAHSGRKESFMNRQDNIAAEVWTDMVGHSRQLGVNIHLWEFLLSSLDGKIIQTNKQTSVLSLLRQHKAQKQLGKHHLITFCLPCLLFHKLAVPFPLLSMYDYNVQHLEHGQIWLGTNGQKNRQKRFLYDC